MLIIRFLIPFVMVFAASATAVAGEYKIEPISAEVAKAYRLDPDYYKKGLLVEDILIATSDQVSDHAIRESAYLFEKMMQSIDPAVAARVREKKVLCILLGHQEFTSDVPQFRTPKQGDALAFYNWRSRGFLNWYRPPGEANRDLPRQPIVLFAEEDVLEYEGGMQLESILIHEFGHVIHGAGFDGRLQQKLTAAFNEAEAQGLWNDGRAAQRFRRVKGETPVLLLDALVKAFPEQSPEVLKKCLDGGDILVNGKPTNAKVQVTGDDEVLIVFGGPKRCYAMANRSEYWAEGVQCWYNTNRTMDHDHNHIHTREQLKAYDPGLAKLCGEVLGDKPWRFVSPRERAGQGHLADYDPQTAPEVVQPEFIQEAALDYYDDYWKDYWQRLVDKHAVRGE